MTRLQRLTRKWNDCDKCLLHETRKNVVMVRGCVPADVVFVGEAPGKSEDNLGVPFVGEAGFMMNQLMKLIEDRCEHFTFAFVNMVGCLPCEDGDREQVRMPNKKEIDACGGRLQALIRLARPELIIAVGKVSASHLPRLLPDRTPMVKVNHPGMLIRLPEEKLQLEVNRFVIKVVDGIHSHVTMEE